MKNHLLGKSGLRVSEICLGAMTFGEEWGWGASKEECRKIFNVYVDTGGNFIDTANKYTEGTSEKYVGEFISGDRERFVLATKYTSNTKRGDPNAGGNHRKNMIQSLNASLKRLNTDYIDLYWVHAWDPFTPIEEVMRSLDDMVKSGKILYAGISDAPAWIVSQANTIANQRGWTEFTGLQIEYNLIERTSERELLPMANALDIGVTAWSPLGNGILTGKYNKMMGKAENHQGQQNLSQTKQTEATTTGTTMNGDDGDVSSKNGVDDRLEVLKSMSPDLLSSLLTDRNGLIVEQVVKIANEIGRSPAQVALNWIRQQHQYQQQQQPNAPLLTTYRKNKIIPIIGARKESQIRDNLECLRFELTNEQLQRLDAISKIELGFPHDFLNSQMVKDIIYGGSAIYSHR
jgi:aryl-alcohol dehydrogenase-like predicted oxidoreductase